MFEVLVMALLVQQVPECRLRIVKPISDIRGAPQQHRKTEFPAQEKHPVLLNTVSLCLCQFLELYRIVVLLPALLEYSRFRSLVWKIAGILWWNLLSFLWRNLCGDFSGCMIWWWYDSMVAWCSGGVISGKFSSSSSVCIVTIHTTRVVQFYARK